MLTIVIPHYNHQDILPRAVASVLLGDTQDFEIIIVDDGSTNDCQAVFDTLEAADPRITVIRCQKNQGAPTALNTGLAAARGEYVTFLGADDFVMPSLYENLLAALKTEPGVALACSEIAIVGTDGEIRGIRPVTPPSFRTKRLTPQDVISTIRRTDNWICNTATIYRTSMIRAEHGYDASLGPFCDGYVSRVLAFKHGFVFVPGVHAVWQVAPHTLSASTLLDHTKGAQLPVTARDSLAASVIGDLAPDYPDAFASRLKFAAARMQFVWNGAAVDPHAVTEVASGNQLDQKVVGFIHRSIGFGKLGRVLALGWLALRRRPIAPLDLIACTIRNRLVLARNRERVAAWLTELEAASRSLATPVATGKPQRVPVPGGVH